MIGSVLIALLIVLPVVSGRHQSSKQRSPNKMTGNQTEKEIIHIENELFASIKSKDIEGLKRILAEDFVYRNATAGEQTRAEFLAAINSIPIKIDAIWSEDMKVNIFADVAVMTGTQKARAINAEGKEETGVTAFTDIFVKRGGRWVLVLAYGVELPSIISGK